MTLKRTSTKATPLERSAGAKRTAHWRARRRAAGLVEVNGMVSESIATEIHAAGGLAAWIEARGGQHQAEPPATLRAGQAVQALTGWRRAVVVWLLRLSA